MYQDRLLLDLGQDRRRDRRRVYRGRCPAGPARAQQSTRIFDSGLGISIFRDNSTRTRFSFASACNLLGLEVQDLDEKKSQIAHGETVRETANMVSFWRPTSSASGTICCSPARPQSATFMDAVKEATATVFWSSSPPW